MITDLVLSKRKLKFDRSSIKTMKQSSELTSKNYLQIKNLFAFAVLLIAIAISFNLQTRSEFLPWDDQEYVKDNADIRAFGKENLKSIFTKNYLGNYQPVTMLSYMLDYQIGENSPFIYHLSNLFFHLLNALLVFILLKKILKQDVYALLFSLVFAVHPVQAESVMWIAERKNMVYTFFFLSAALFYMKFNKQGGIKYYVICLLLFILSLLSKGTAVAFSLCLFAFDYIQGKKISWKSVLNKVPFFAGALVTGLITLRFQREAGFINTEHDFGFFTKLLYGSYAFFFYIIKVIVPVKLSAYYPYPQSAGLWQYLSLAGFALFIAAVIMLIRKKERVMAGALLFFFFNIMFVLQFIPFGETLVAERYNYLSIVGLLLFLAALATKYGGSFVTKKTLVFASAATLLLPLMIFSRQRSAVWNNRIEFYDDILKKYPESYVVLNSLGAEYMRIDKFDKAQEYFNRAKAVKPDYYSVYYNEALSYLKQQKEERALFSLNECIRLKRYYKALYARASIYERHKHYEEAIADLNECLKLNDKYAMAYYLRALCIEQSGNATASLNDYNSAIRLKPDEAIFYLNRAIALGKVSLLNESLNDLDKAIVLKPDYGQAYYLRAVGKYKTGKNPCEDLMKAASLGERQADEAAKKMCR